MTAENPLQGVVEALTTPRPQSRRQRRLNIRAQNVNVSQVAPAQPRGRNKARQRRRNTNAATAESLLAQPGVAATPAATINAPLSQGALTSVENFRTRQQLGAIRGMCGDCDPNAMSWYFKYLDPIGTTESGRAIGEFGKVPDGLVKFSVDAEIRVVYDEEFPGREAGVMPLDGKLWSISFISYPMFRTAYIVAANIYDLEFSQDAEIELCRALNRLPDWRVIVSLRAWTPFGAAGDGWFYRIRQLPPTYDVPDPTEGDVRTVTDYRITYKAIALRFNANDLLDVGWWIGGHYALSPSQVSSQSDDALGHATTFSAQRITNGWIIYWPKFPMSTSSGLPFRATLMDTDSSVAVSGPSPGPIHVLDPDYAGSDPFVDTGDTVNISVSSVPATLGQITISVNNGNVYVVPGTAQAAVGTIITPETITEDGRNTDIDYSINRIDLPPMTVNQTAANNPKIEQFLCKYSGGAYVVHSKMRNPVFELTRANQFGAVHFLTPGYNSAEDDLVARGIRDSIDQNMSTSVIHIRSISQSTSFQTTTMQGWEGVTATNTPFGQFAHSGLEKFAPILDLADDLATRLTGVYEEEDNMAALVASFAANALSNLMKSEATQAAVAHIGTAAVNTVASGLTSTITKIPAVLARIPSVFARVGQRIRNRRTRRRATR